jgi:hypothetical protein
MSKLEELENIIATKTELLNLLIIERDELLLEEKEEAKRLHDLTKLL